MPLKLKHIILLLSMLAGFNKLQAQDSTLIGKTIIWDLVKCIDYAKKNNIQINSLRLSQKISQQEYLLSKAARLPDLSGSASQNFEHSKANGGYNSSTNTSSGSGFTASGSYGLSSNVTLYNGNYLTNSIQQKNLAVQSANLNIIQQENDITLQITQAYLAILLDKENIIYDTELVNTTQAQVKLAQQRYKRVRHLSSYRRSRQTTSTPLLMQKIPKEATCLP
jgi:outer membrane protein